MGDVQKYCVRLKNGHWFEIFYEWSLIDLKNKLQHAEEDFVVIDGYAIRGSEVASIRHMNWTGATYV
jgi:hypothetical protein